VAGGKKKRRRKYSKRAPRKIIKREIFPSFNSVTLRLSIISAAAAEIASVSSEFDIFAHRSIHTSVLGTRRVAYKPTARGEQNDLEFLYLPISTRTLI